MDNKVTINSEGELTAFGGQASSFYQSLERIASDLEDRLRRVRAFQAQMRDEIDLDPSVTGVKTIPTRVRPTVPARTGSEDILREFETEAAEIARRFAPETTPPRPQAHNNR